MYFCTPTLQLPPERICTATAIPIIYSFPGNSAASAPVSTFMSVSDLYIPRIGPHISSSRKGRPTVRIYNSLTDTWMWKLGLRPRYSFSGNICFKFSAFCFCSVRDVWHMSYFYFPFFGVVIGLCGDLIRLRWVQIITLPSPLLTFQNAFLKYW